MQRRFISSVEALGLSDDNADPDRRTRTAAPDTAAALPGRATGAATRALLNTPVFLYGKRILQMLAAQTGGVMPIGDLIAALQKDVGGAFNITDALTAIRDLQDSGALTSDGTVCAITKAGRAAAI